MHRELSDQTFVAVDRGVLAAVVADPARVAGWWPDLRFEVSRDRGPKGRQWRLTGDIGGTAEIYLEPWHDGTVLHLFLRLELPDAPPGRVRRRMDARVLNWKRTVHRLKDQLEAGRAAGSSSAQ